jgi:hypothetical protein
MSTKQVLLTQIDNFINELCTIFQNNGEMLLFREKYNLVRGVNSNLVIEYFITYIYPFKKNIMNMEESFFLDGGGQEELKDKSGLKFRDSIKTLWITQLSEENKEIIWKYFKIFILLCEKYIIENTK